MTEAFSAVLDGREVDVRLGAAVTTTTYDLSMESTAALTIAVQDQKRELLKSGILDLNKDGRLDASVEIVADGARYRIAAVSKAADTFSLVFEDRVVSLLRSARGTLKPTDGADHVAFARLLVKRVGAKIITPTGVAAVRSGNPLEYKRERSDADERREKGIADEADLKVKGVKVTSDQIREIEVAMGVAADENAGEKPTLAMICAGIGESDFKAIANTAGSNYHGVFQGSKSVWEIGDTAGMAKSFLRGGKGFQQGGAIELAKEHPTMSPGEIATRVEGSGKPGSFYGAYGAEASAIVLAYGGIGPNSDLSGTRAATLVQRGTTEDPLEDSWTALVRIGEAKGWRVFALRNKIYYAREQDLVKSRPRATLSEDKPGIDWIDWEVSPRKKVNAATVQCRASLWALPPGCCVLVKGQGMADGRWLVSSFRRSRDSQAATVELRRGTELLRPPKTRETTGTDTATTTGEEGAVFSAANAISGEKRDYVYGGGHGKPLADITGTEGLDCSSSTCLALHRAGVFPGTSAQTSGILASSFGEPGEGKDFTLWANSEHVFVTFSGAMDGYRFDTSPHAGDDPMDRGPRMRKGKRSTAGFTPRRVKGSG